jgi:hypothetical protein
MARSMSREDWIKAVQWVDDDCIIQRGTITWVDQLSTKTLNHAAREFLKIIDRYDRKISSSITTYADKVTHKFICRSMLQYVLFPGITEWNTSIVTSDFMKELMVLSLPSLKDITCLWVATDTTHECSWLLVNNIWMLRHLQEFYFPFGCCRQILLELAKHCSQLKRLSIMSSKDVDDRSVFYLRHLRKLVYLNIDGTAITHRGYSYLLSHLKKVKNITWTGRVDNVLMNITKEFVPSVKLLIAAVTDADTVPMMCPLITRLSLHRIRRSLSDLTELTRLAELTLDDCHYDTVKLGDILEGSGHRFKELHLRAVKNVRIGDVVTMCTDLQTLTMESCDLILKDGALIGPLFPHFLHLALLELTANRWRGDFQTYLNSYVSLKALIARNTPELDNTAVVSVVKSKGFEELKEFSAHDCGSMSMKLAVLLMENCYNLTRLGGVGTWTAVTSEVDMTYVLNKAKYAKVQLV